MITKFKIYESINVGKPKIGDYVICKEIGNNDEIYNTFLNSTIGKIVYIGTSKYRYIVQYNNVPTVLLSYFGSEQHYELCRGLQEEEIIYWSENKEELAPFIDQNKYNL